MRCAAPATLAGAAISGVVAGETLVGIDYHPGSGQLYGFGVNAAADTGTLYLLDLSGSATAVGVPGRIKFDFGGTGIPTTDLPAGGYGMDFDRTGDIRITTQSGLNFRIEPTLGGPRDGSTIVLGVQPDVAINGGGSGVSATAYTNSFGQLPGQMATQYSLDSASDTLFIQAGNLGTLLTPHAVTLNGSPLDFTSVSGFDIPSGVAVFGPPVPGGITAFGFGLAATSRRRASIRCSTTSSSAGTRGAIRRPASTPRAISRPIRMSPRPASTRSITT